MSEGIFAGFKKFIHWGPLTAIGIIKCITLMTLYMNSMWWPPNRSTSGFLNQTLFLILSAMTGFNFVMASLCGPKFLPFGWKPQDKKSEEYLQFCQDCQGYKAPRSHHCRKCNRCVIKMDHHCPWINNCVGWGNHAYFTAFLSFAVIGCSHAAVILAGSLYTGIHRQWYLFYGKYHLATVNLALWSLILCVFSLGLAIGVIIAVGMLLFFQLRAIFRNRTAIEDWIVEKAKYRREHINELEKFIYPYDLGLINNLRQVASLSCEPIGNGIDWKIIDGCDQYTLTREQISQKAEKRARTRTYRIIKESTGSWVPLWSQGIKVCVNVPWTDEPRIKLYVGDTVKITRWRKYWLFGEKIYEKPVTTTQTNGKNKKTKKMKNTINGGGNNINNNNNNIKNNSNNNINSINYKSNISVEKELIIPRVRGWFPRPCAVELVTNDNDEYEDDEEIVQLNSKQNNHHHHRRQENYKKNN